MMVARVQKGLRYPLSVYPVLYVLKKREDVQGRRRRGAILRSQADEQISALDAEERLALDSLRAVLKDYRAVTQERVARALRLDRTMVNKVWNSGLPGRERQWTRSARIIAATYRALEAEGWSPVPAEKTA